MKRFRSIYILPIVLLFSFVAISAYSETYIPEWVKNSAYWWSQDTISDTEFVNTIQYLIDNGIITVPQNTVVPVNEIFQQAVMVSEGEFRYVWMDTYGNLGKDRNGNVVYYDIDNLETDRVGEPVTQSPKSNEKLEMFFPSRADLDNGWIIKENIDFQPAVPNIPVKSKTYTYSNQGVKIFIYEFDSPNKSRVLYDDVVNGIREKGGYTEMEVPVIFHGGIATNEMFYRHCFGLETNIGGSSNAQIRCVSELNNYYVFVTAVGSNDNFDLAFRFMDIILVKIEGF